MLVIMLYHFSEARCVVESLVESFTATASESVNETDSESTLRCADDGASCLPNAVLCITNVREHTMIPPNTNHTKPEFLIHQYVQVDWGIADSLAAATPGQISQKNMLGIYDKKV
jgi:hypothetical protein